MTTETGIILMAVLSVAMSLFVAALAMYCERTALRLRRRIRVREAYIKQLQRTLAAVEAARCNREEAAE